MLYPTRLQSTRIVFLSLLVALLSQLPAAAQSRQDEIQVPFQRIEMETYQNFLKNWDDAKNPILVALVESPEQYENLFGAAAFQGNRKPFAPPHDLFQKECILVVGRVIPASGDRSKIMQVKSLMQRDNTLELSFSFQPPKDPASSQEKHWLQLRIPKGSFDLVRFLENDKPVAELHRKQGQWASPIPPRD
ncbi:MAG: hypothetical protein ACK5ZC_03030 [Pirellulaceae bacterium]|jgi:hypothetical protein